MLNKKGSIILAFICMIACSFCISVAGWLRIIPLFLAEALVFLLTFSFFSLLHYRRRQKHKKT